MTNMAGFDLDRRPKPCLLISWRNGPRIKNLLSHLCHRGSSSAYIFCLTHVHAKPSFIFLHCLNHQLWSAYVPCSAQHLDAVQIAVEQIDVIKRLVDKYKDSFSLVTSVSGELNEWSSVHCFCSVDVFHLSKLLMSYLTCVCETPDSNTTQAWKVSRPLSCAMQ